ncbi:hypothetical protein ALC62_10894 [Cyphomyrmex costatus]|uniref:Protein CUSTOS n=2 Tax=Cyphomyrmex costatus TaxID=456900 RepID=A0A151ID94_9HYME|nr:hypothetical protein ALC62_10894 [Cyphomyrmex costatus]
MKKISKQVDSSSSEDENFTNNLKEAIDQQFLNNNLYSVEKVKAVSQSEPKTSKLDKSYSLRLNSKQEDNFTNFGVTATFQSFIAKKLDEILERSIKMESDKIANYCDKQKQRKDKNFGIKLLSTSNKLLTVAKVEEECMEYKKKFKRNRQIREDDETSSKFQEAVIDPESILNKLDTKAWVNKRPESDFKYKRLKNGTLIEM